MMDYNASKPGYVYILTNPSFREDWVKIGKSSRPVDVRSKELDNTAIPLPFEIYAVMKTVKYNKVEKLVHRYLERFVPLRIRPNREFFNIKPETALQIFKDIAETIDDAEIILYNNQNNKQITEQISYSEKEPAAKGRKNPRFSIDGKGNYSKRQVSFIVMKKYVLTSRPKYNELLTFLNDRELSKWIKPSLEVPRENPDDKDWKQRWNFKEPLVSSDGIEFLVSLQAGDKCPLDFEKICKVSDLWGFHIEKIV